MPTDLLEEGLAHSEMIGDVGEGHVEVLLKDFLWDRLHDSGHRSSVLTRALAVGEGNDNLKGKGRGFL